MMGLPIQFGEPIIPRMPENNSENLPDSFTVTVKDIEDARDTISEFIRPTPLSFTNQLSRVLGADCYLKLENLQRTGSFKIRGALNKISALSDKEKARGVIASSAGNHAQGVACSATSLGVKSTIVMPQTAPLVKVEATQAYGATIIQEGTIYDEAYAHAKELEERHGYVFVHPFQDPKIIAGQGTIGLELLDKLPDMDTAVISVGGGGLISGIATAIKAKNPKCRIIGVQAAAAPAMAESFRTKKMTVVEPNSSTLADGVAVKNPSKLMYDNFLSRLVDDIVTVTDEEIAQSIFYLMERVKTVVEGSGALPIAAAMNGKIKLGKKNLFLLCGGNIDLNMAAKIIEQSQKRLGRRCRLSVVTRDVPGSLLDLTSIIADNGANVLEVVHDRASGDLFLRETRIDFVLETRNQAQIDKIKAEIKESGARIL